MESTSSALLKRRMKYACKTALANAILLPLGLLLVYVSVYVCVLPLKTEVETALPAAAFALPTYPPSRPHGFASRLALLAFKPHLRPKCRDRRLRRDAN